MVKRNSQTVLNIIILIICINFNAIVSDIIKNNKGETRSKGDKIDDTTQSRKVRDDFENDLVADFFDHVQEIYEREESDAINTTYPKGNFFLTKSPLSSSVKALRFLETTTNKKKNLAVFDNMTVSSTIYTFRVRDTDPVSTYKLISTKRITTESTPMRTKQYQKKTTKPTTTLEEDDYILDVDAYKLIRTKLITTESTSMRKITKQYEEKTTKTTEEDDYILDTEESLGPISTESERELDIMDQQTRKLSCILCDNVSNKDCNNPENKLLPLINCERKSDVCYTMQTPFGIVDRGCFSPLENHTTYVCSCNLCNTIPLHDLPQTYTNKSEWLFNVQELSHGRMLRKSVYSQMACVQCEVNQTIDEVPDINCLEGKYQMACVQCEVNQTIDEVPDINCLEGKYRILPSQYCEFDEICGIRSIRSQGYIWRGCIKYPRYNYLWSFCENDLCNFDAPTSLFDIEEP